MTSREVIHGIDPLSKKNSHRYHESWSDLQITVSRNFKIFYLRCFRLFFIFKVYTTIFQYHLEKIYYTNNLILIYFMLLTPLTQNKCSRNAKSRVSNILIKIFSGTRILSSVKGFNQNIISLSCQGFYFLSKDITKFKEFKLGL